LQHGQGIRGKVERILKTAGADLVSTHNSHLCCGAAGTYSVLQSELANRLLDQKISDLNQEGPELIVTANLGCLAHLASSSPVPVRHWIELIDPSPLS
jgi:glycolate oxidase iron-sulfur subunit